MIDEEFTAFCAEHPDLDFEMTADGELIVVAPSHSICGVRKADIGAQLFNWAKGDRRGLACGSSTGFVLPNGARRSPDASWTVKTRVRRMDPKEREGFWHLCPDFVIELRSDSDPPRTVQRKMQEYLTNGAELGWLIDPESRSVEVYRTDGRVVVVTGINQIHGEGPVAGFILDLTDVWDPLAD